MNTNVIETASAIGAETVTQEGDIPMENKVYTFRTLNSTDMFVMFKILSKIGINEFTECLGKDSVKSLLAGLTGENARQNATTAVGISVMLEFTNIILGNLPKCEAEVYELLSRTSNLTTKEVKELDFITFTEMVIDFVKKDEFKDFVKVAARLFKQAN